MRKVDPVVAERVILEAPGKTDAALMPSLGISYNTFRKIRAGEPIRSSVAERLEHRVRGITDWTIVRSAATSLAGLRTSTRRIVGGQESP